LSDPAPRPTPGSLAGLVALGALSTLWSLVLWASLWQSRSGLGGSCPLGDGAACGDLWDGPFATAVQGLTGLPVAGWGLAWGVVALVLPLEALRRHAEGRVAGSLVTACRVTGAAGLLASLGLAAVALGGGSFCAGCFVSYVIAAGYAGIAVFSWKPFGLPEIQSGVATAAATLVLVWLALLYPGSRTPSPAADPASTAAQQAPVSASGADAALHELVESLEPRARQALADSLAIYAASSPRSMPPSRDLHGPAGAPVQITEFTDALCPHCADLHRTLGQIERLAPEGRLAIDSRQYPLDASCNPAVQRSGEPVRCAAARARVCLEGDPGARDLASALFDAQQGLTEERVLEIASRFRPRPELEACLASEETAARLRADVELADSFGIEGTPLVIVNGRKATSFGAFLYALALTRGEVDHPAFAALPAGRADAHLH
jgi:serine/threonine-protein kinase